MFQPGIGAVLSTKSLVFAAASVAALSFFGVAGAKADNCVQQCRAQHNACRMASKLLSSAACDSQLQSCVSRCMSRR